MKKLAIAINIILCALVILFDELYISYSELWMKATASILFTLIGAVNLCFACKAKTEHKKFCIVLLVGLVFAMLGDIVLNLHFISGAALFGVGHIFFFVSFCFLVKFTLKDLLYGAIIFVPSLLFIVLAPFFDFGGVLMEIVCIIYALIISCMVGKALSNLISAKSILTIVIFIGTVLFFFSDLMLLLNVFGGLPKFVDILCLATYYPAEIILGFSILLSSNILNKAG